MEQTKYLKQYEKNVLTCLRCGYCRETYRPRTNHHGVCPVREELGFESTYARGRLNIARTVLGYNAITPLKYTPGAAESVYKCVMCGNCKEVCGPGVDTFAVWKAMRADIIESGVKIPEGLTKLGEAVEKTHNIFEAPEGERTEWITPDIKVEKKADLVYFPGCVTAYRFPEIAQSIARILNEADVKFATLGPEEWCCGNPLILTGQLPLANEMVKHNISKLKEIGAKRVVTACPGCYRCLTQEYPVILEVEKLPFEVLHTSQLLAELIDAEKIKFIKAVEGTLVYHDPCELGRHSKVYDPPRKVIDSIPGIKRVEMLRHKAGAWCCGGGGGVKAAFPELALKIASARLYEAKETGATTIVSACPNCKWNISEAIEKTKPPLKMIDITELCAKAMGI